MRETCVFVLFGSSHQCKDASELDEPEGTVEDDEEPYPECQPEEERISMLLPELTVSILNGLLPYAQLDRIMRASIDGHCLPNTLAYENGLEEWGFLIHITLRHPKQESFVLQFWTMDLSSQEEPWSDRWILHDVPSVFDALYDLHIPLTSWKYQIIRPPYAYSRELWDPF